MIGALIGAAGSLIGGGISAATTARENRKDREFNAQQAQLNRDFNAAEAQKNRDYQTEMSNTAMQRRVADLQAAGLNPALAYSQGGATSPGGSSASGSSASSHANTFQQSAAMVANAFSAIGDAITARQAANQALKGVSSFDRARLERIYQKYSFMRGK